MHFLRCQEYYESPNPHFKGHIFNLVEYMEWYIKEYTAKTDSCSFTYADDWSGFNIPSWVLHDVITGTIPDFNKYDGFMTDLYWSLSGKYGPDFYLIGARNTDDETLQHEIAHGFWYTTPQYKKEMQSLIAKIEPDTYNVLRNSLLNNGYCEDVIDDEIQAYSSTGLCHFLKDDLRKIDAANTKLTAPFRKLFKKYYKMPV